MLRLGITGGIGSGKTSVANILSRMGAHILDADAISRSLTAVGGKALPRISEVFGSALVSKDGSLDRNRMRSLIFSNPEAKCKLEAIIHPLVQAEIQSMTLEAVAAGCSCAVYDIPLLVESGRWRPALDKVLVVDCPPEVQINRVKIRNNLTEAQIHQIMASQSTRENRLIASDMVIFNGAEVSLNLLAQELASLAPSLGLESTEKT